MEPRIVVFSTLFPNPSQPNAGVFIRERMFRVGQKIPIIVLTGTDDHFVGKEAFNCGIKDFLIMNFQNLLEEELANQDFACFF